MWGVLSEERTGLSFTIAAGPHQHSHSRVRVPLDSRPYFTVSFSSPRTTRRATLEVFDPASTRDNSRLSSPEFFFITTLHEPNIKHCFQQYSYCCVFTDPFLINGFFYCCMRVHFRGNLFTKPLPSIELFRLSGFMSQYASFC
jgi:hypothetical protein